MYRVIVLDGEQMTPKWKYEARNQYFPGIKNKASFDESEVLLYPNLHFGVIKNSPSRVKVKVTL